MKTIQEIRLPFDFHADRQSSRIIYLKDYNIDFDVFLPSKGS